MSTTPENDFRSILATDCGSTTTKAILIQKIDGVYRQTYRGEAPTTVEAPFEDVTRGVLNAAQEIGELMGRKIVRDDGSGIITPEKESEGVDIYISTSSAGGGLQVVVAGVVRSMTTESAMRAALGSGAIVMDAFSTNDKRPPHEQIEKIRQLRPDMILLAGGVDGGTEKHVIALAERICAAQPRTRLGGDFNLPIIFAGNKQVREPVSKLLEDICALEIVDNVRPVMEKENLAPARDKIHDLFMEHVMAQAPGYGKLMKWVSTPIMPTPGAVGQIMKTIAEQRKINILGVDIGGATTDVFSVFDSIFNRTVSANLGMSYSVSNVLAEAGLAHVLRWIPFRIDAKALRNRIGNKMIRPTTIPQTLEELQVEQAIAREALRLAFIQHKTFAVGLKGVQKQRGIADAFAQEGSDTIVQMMNLDLIVGSGGVLSHAPRRAQTMRMLIDAYQPEGYTEIAVDSIFMMPHLGVLSTIHLQAATDVFEKDCLVYLGSCIAPIGDFDEKSPLLKLHLTLPQEPEIEEILSFGELYFWSLAEGQEANVRITPLQNKLDLGNGPAQPISLKAKGGKVGLVIDTRGRPIRFPHNPEIRTQTLYKWCSSMDEYPEGER
ncbi:MAG: glutamate mutase L [Myxococcota bacterium]|nr:glutamate mutase L [Myxococcota bacterium]